MPLFVIDTCADTVDGQKKYLAAFFRDVFRLNGYCVVVGGTKHWKEINGKEGLLNVIFKLKQAGRIKVVQDLTVDTKEHELRSRTMSKMGSIPTCCDDFHILALCLLSECRNVITSEQRLRECVDQIRSKVGHSHCPQVRIIRDEPTYLALKSSGQL